ncbi:MAG: DUF1289 domain-containing protein [Pseudomonadota bacterium]
MTQTALASPCTGICKLDDTTGWCLGCARSGVEIADWRTQSESWRDQLWSELPERLAKLGVACRRLPWSTQEIVAFVTETLARDRGTWVMGVVGAVAEFSPSAGRPRSSKVTDAAITAHTSGGALRMMIDDSVRAVTFDPASTPTEAIRIVLAVKRERGRLPVADQITDLNEDPSCLIERDAGRLFDLGLGRKEARFCVRATSDKVRSALAKVAGQPLSTCLSTLGPTLIHHSPSRVVETALGRIEVHSPIPKPGARSPDGPHTHLLPDHLATGRCMPVGMDLPRAYLPGAIFYP